MKQVNSFRYWLLATLLICVGMTAKAFDLTVTDGSKAHNSKVYFKVNGGAAQEDKATANKDDKVTIEITTEDHGWQVDKVTATAYTSWNTAGARSDMPMDPLPTVKVLKTWTGSGFTYEIDKMPGYNVQIDVTYKTSALTDAMIQKPIKDQDWTGNPITLSTGENGDLKVMDGSTLLIAGTDYDPSYENNTDPGENTAKVTITGKNGYAGSTASAYFSIIKTLSGDNVSCADKTYTGSKLETEVTVVDGSTTLKKGVDYDVTYPTDPTANINAGTGAGKVTVTFKGKYKGTVNATFNILPRSLKDNDVSKPEKLDDMTYTGIALTPNLNGKITYNGMTLKQEGADKDYTLAYANNTNVGTATITVSGKGNYKDDITVTFDIKEGASSVTKAPEPINGLVYNGEAQTLITAGTASGGEMQYSTDGTNWSKDLPKKTDANEGYTVYYKVVGDDNHSDTEPQTLSVKIAKASLSEVVLTGVPKTYNGSEQKPASATVKAGTLTVNASEYDVVGGDKGTAADTYTYQVKAKATSTNYQGEAGQDWVINKDNLSQGFTVELTPSTYVYGGDKKVPVVVVKKGTRIVDASEYTAVPSNHQNAGTATMTITGKNVNYTGSTSKTFTINPAPLIENGVTLESDVLTYNPDGNEVTITSVTAAGQTGNSATATTLTLTNTEWEVVSGSNKGVDVGDYVVTVNPKTTATNYTGTATKEWKIVAKDISEVTAELIGGPWTYNGSYHTPDVIVKDGEHILTPYKNETTPYDYSVRYENNKEAGINTAKVIIEGHGNYKETKILTFTIDKSEGKVAIEEKWDLTYGEGEQTKQLTLTPADLTNVQWLSGNTDVATVDNNGLVTVTGAGVTTIYALVLGDNNYVSSWATCVVTVTPQKITDVIVGAIGAKGVSVITAKNAAGETLAEGTDYEIVYTDKDENEKTIEEMRENADKDYIAVITFGGNYQGIVKKKIDVQKDLMDTDDLIDVLLSIATPADVTPETAQYDFNEDGQLDIADLQALMNLKAYGNINGPATSRATDATSADAVMTVSTEEMGGGVTRYALSLDGDREFSAFMMDVTANGAMQVVGQQAAAADMTLHTGTLQNGTLRLLGIGAEQSGSVVYIDVMGEGGLNIENICFSTKSANAFYARLAGNATSIDQLRAATADGEYFGIGGQRQNELKKGVNIVRQNGKAVKVIRK